MKIDSIDDGRSQERKVREGGKDGGDTGLSSKVPLRKQCKDRIKYRASEDSVP